MLISTHRAASVYLPCMRAASWASQSSKKNYPCARFYCAEHKVLGQDLRARTAVLKNGTSLSNIEQDFLECVQAGRIAEVQKMLQMKNIDVNVRNAEQQTALHLACLNGDLQMVELLLVEASANVHAINYCSALTPLVSICQQPCTNTLHDETTAAIGRLLIQYGANIHAQSLVLHQAIKNNYYKLSELLLEKGVSTTTVQNDLSLVYTAMKINSPELLKLLLKYGATAYPETFDEECMIEQACYDPARRECLNLIKMVSLKAHQIIEKNKATQIE